MTDGTVPESEHEQESPEDITGESVDAKPARSHRDAVLRGETPSSVESRDDEDTASLATDSARSNDPAPPLPVASEPLVDSRPDPIEDGTKPEPTAENAPDEKPETRRVNPFSGASDFFSVRGFLAASSLFLLTLIVCLLAVDLIWALAISLLFTVAVSTGHLVFYTRDRQVRERVYFSIMAIGAFCGGALVVDLQLTHPYFIELREFNQATQTLKEHLNADERFAQVKLSTKLTKIRTASFAGTVQKRHHLRALELLAEEAGFAVGENEVTVVGELDAPDKKPSAEATDVTD